MDEMQLYFCTESVVEVKNSAVEHERSAMRFLARVKFGETIAIGYHFYILMQADLYGDKYLDRQCG